MTEVAPLGTSIAADLADRVGEIVWEVNFGVIEIDEQALDEAKTLARKLDIPLHLLRVVDTYRTQSLPATGMALDYSMLAELAEEEIEDA